MDNTPYIVGGTIFCNRVLSLIEQRTSWGKNELEKEIAKLHRKFIVDAAKNSSPPC